MCVCVFTIPREEKGQTYSLIPPCGDIHDVEHARLCSAKLHSCQALCFYFHALQLPDAFCDYLPFVCLLSTHSVFLYAVAWHYFIQLLFKLVERRKKRKQLCSAFCNHLQGYSLSNTMDLHCYIVIFGLEEMFLSISGQLFW